MKALDANADEGRLLPVLSMRGLGDSADADEGTCAP
jgi:hypothetical protein